MNAEERKSANNLIYLCGQHHDVIDAQLDYHTVDFLHAAKKAHEEKVARAVGYAMGKVGFDELELICKAISQNSHGGRELTPIDPPSAIQAKIDFNGLSEASSSQILLGLAKADEVRRFVQGMDSLYPGFGDSLSARFKAAYFNGVADGLSDDTLFDYLRLQALQNCGAQINPVVEAAALSVVSYLFEICEIFEYERSPTN